MTREEAITIIGNLEDKDILFNPCDVQDAKTMAIKALEQEPSGDLISRQAVIDACEQSINILEAVDRIMDLPSIEQEPKIGHWIWCVGSHKCSNCEEYTCFSHKELLRYCPNCGARMVEPQESEK